MDGMPLSSVNDPEVLRLSTIASHLSEVRNNIAVNGMSRETAIGLESFHPGVLGENTNFNRYTMHPSATNQAMAMESIDWVRTGIAATLIISIATAIYKLFKWVVDKATEYLDRKMQERTKTAAENTVAVEVAAANARPVEPPPMETVAQTHRKLYDRIVHRSAHTLNPILYALCKVAESRNIPDKDVEFAARELEMLYSRLGDEYVALYTTLALDFDNRVFSGLLNVCDVVKMTPRSTRLYDKLDMQGVANSTGVVRSLIKALTGMTKRFKAGDIRGIPVNMSTLEARLRDAVEVINGSPAESGFYVKITVPEGFQNLRQDDRMTLAPAGYTVISMERLDDIYNEIEQWENVRYGIWPSRNQGYRIESPVRHHQWFKRITEPATLRKVATQLVYDAKPFENTMQSFQQLARDAMKDIETVRNDIQASKGKPWMAQTFKFTLASMSGPVRDYETTPDEMVKRALSFVEQLNAATLKQIASYVKLDNALMQLLQATTSGATNYDEMLSKYEYRA